MVYDVWLTKVNGIGCYLQRKLLSVFGTAERVYHADIDELLNVPGLGKVKSQSILKEKDLQKAEKILRDCQKQDIQIMNLSSPFYPEKAKRLKDMPTVLYYKGNPQIMERYAGIVGSRRCSQQGKQKTIELVDRLLAEDVAIVSGMAKGIDSYAHTACLLQGGYTIAVLANGLDICYPSEHEKLRDRIVEEGLLLSEYEPGIPASRFRFPPRNRIIAAISDEIYVPEMSERSGAEYTIQYAVTYGRKIGDVDA